MEAIEQATGLNTLDLLLIVLLFIGVLLGLVRGIVPQVVSAVSVWLGLVVTLWLYKPFSFRIFQGLDMARVVADTIAFLILIFVFFIAVRLIISFLAVPPEERRKKKKDEEDPLAEAVAPFTERFIFGPLRALGSMVMGFGLTSLWLSIWLGVFQFIFQDRIAQAASGFTGQLRSSLLVETYFNQILWGLAQSVDLFIPRNADIFRIVITNIMGA